MKIFLFHSGDLFPALDVPRKRDLDFEKMVKQAALDLKLQPEDGFILKVNMLHIHSPWIINWQAKKKKERTKEKNFSPFFPDFSQVVQLEELFHVRHSVFIVGFAGTGKTDVWKTLNRTYVNQKLKPHYNDLNPKAVTNDELFGVINPATREWKDGLEDTAPVNFQRARSSARYTLVLGHAL